jgi:hypothetical protein
MIISASAENGSSAAHILFHQRHGIAGLDVEPAAVEAHALADQSYPWRIGRAAVPLRISNSRGASLAAAPTVWIIGNGLLVSRRSSPTIIEACAERIGQTKRAVCQRGGPEQIGWRVDEIAPEDNTARLGDGTFRARSSEVARRTSPRLAGLKVV